MIADQQAQKQLREMLADLLQLEEDLSDWELDFIDSLANWDGRITDRQAFILKRLWRKEVQWRNVTQTTNTPVARPVAAGRRG